MFKILIALVLAIPLVCHAAAPNETTKTLAVTGSIYRTCKIETTNTTLNLGSHSASMWGSGNNWLNHGTEVGRDFIINISECDLGTVIKLKGDGPNGGGAYNWWLKNQVEGGPENLYVSIGLMKKGSDTEYTTLYLDNNIQRTYMTVTSSEVNAVVPLKLRGTFRRIDTNDVPVGNFSGSFTVIFTFE